MEAINLPALLRTVCDLLGPKPWVAACFVSPTVATISFVSLRTGAISGRFAEADSEADEDREVIVIANETQPGALAPLTARAIGEITRHKVADVVTIWGDLYQAVNGGIGEIPPAPGSKAVDSVEPSVKSALIEPVEPLPDVQAQASAWRAILADPASVDIKTVSLAATSVSVNDALLMWLLPRLSGAHSPLDAVLGQPPVIGAKECSALTWVCSVLPDYLAIDVLALAAFWTLAVFGPTAQVFIILQRAKSIDRNHHLVAMVDAAAKANIKIPLN